MVPVFFNADFGSANGHVLTEHICVYECKAK